MHCREAANTVRRLFSMVRRSFCELSKAAFLPLYCDIVRPHLEYGMEANAPKLRADINQPERVSVTCRMEERLCQLKLFLLKRRRLRADLILAFKILKGEVDLSLSDLLPPSTPSRAKRAYPQVTARIKPSLTQERCIFCACCETMEQI